MPALPRVDIHMHTMYLGCANATMAASAMAEECARLRHIQPAWQVAEQLQLTADRTWLPPGQPLAAAPPTFAVRQPCR